MSNDVICCFDTRVLGRVSFPWHKGLLVHDVCLICSALLIVKVIFVITVFFLFFLCFYHFGE